MSRFPIVHTLLAATLASLAAMSASAQAQSTVQYGRITNVVATTEASGQAQNIGTLVGGGLGLLTGSGQSGSNRALRGLGGAAAGRAVGNVASRAQVFEYTVLVGGGTTIRIVSDQAGKRVGDCVAVEQGQFSNIRLVPDARCTPPQRQNAAAAKAAPAKPAPVPQAAVDAATACDRAKAQVLAAETDEAFTLAERRMRLLCGE